LSVYLDIKSRFYDDNLRNIIKQGLFYYNRAVMKKLLIILSTVLIFALPSFAERYVVFFAETSEIPQNVLNAINQSKRFALNVPISSALEAPESLEELISYGKIEPSLVFIPEPVFPILLYVYSMGSNKAAKMDVFKDYIDNNISTFERNIYRKRFGLFLRSGEASNSVIEYFAKKNLMWINISNMANNLYGIFSINGLNAFSLFEALPLNAAEAVKWINSRNEDVIPVLLTKDHLQNIQFMTAIINAFDNNKNILPATPLYITQIQREKIIRKNEAPFVQMKVNSFILERLSDAASMIERYRNSSKYNEPLYRNAQDELIYLCSKEFLLSLKDASLSNSRMFDAAYANIYRLLNGEAPLSADETPINEPPPIFDDDAESAAAIDDGIRVDSKGTITSVSIAANDSAVTIKVSFSKGRWVDNISYVDVYVDINHVENIGLSSMLDGAGYLTPASAWEYAIKITKNKAVLYRAVSDKPALIGEFDANNGVVSIPRQYIRGNPRNWGVQAIAVQISQKDKKILDFLSGDAETKKKALTLRTVTIPAIKIKR
jgi:hypothetical protein